jgi:hypothetical protein
MDMSDFTPVTEDVLDRAREDHCFRHKLVSQHLDLLMRAMSRMRDRAAMDGETTRQLQEGARLAVQLTEILHSVNRRTKPAPKLAPAK